jgi:hypothetical protein
MRGNLTMRIGNLILQSSARFLSPMEERAGLGVLRLYVIEDPTTKSFIEAREVLKGCPFTSSLDKRGNR